MSVCVCVCVCVCVSFVLVAYENRNPRQSEPWQIDLGLGRHRAANYHGPTSQDLNHNPKCQRGCQGVALGRRSPQPRSSRRAPKGRGFTFAFLSQSV